MLKLGDGVERCRISEAPWYVDLINEVCQRMNWDAERFRGFRGFRGFRARIEYPVYGSQIVIAYDGRTRPTETAGVPVE